MLRMAHRLLDSYKHVDRPDHDDRSLEATSRAGFAVYDSLQASCPVIIADNIERMIAPSGTYCFDNLPAIRMPFDTFFLEFDISLPPLETVPRKGHVVQQGFAVAPMTYEDVSRAVCSTDADSRASWQDIGDPVNGMTAIESWTFGDGACCAVGIHQILFDAEYNYVDHCRRYLIDPHTEGYEAAVAQYEPWTNYGVFTLLKAMAFLTCQNINIIDVTYAEAPTPKWCRRKRLPELKYSTIVVDPEKTRILRRGDKSSNHPGVAFHIRRGRFATYVDDGISKGLFGRGIYGTFWVASHTVGDPDVGLIQQAYIV